MTVLKDDCFCLIKIISVNEMAIMTEGSINMVGIRNMRVNRVFYESWNCAISY